MRRLMLALALTTLASTAAHAAPKDYRFDVAPAAVGSGDPAVVKLIHVPSGKVVEDAEIHMAMPVSNPKGTPGLSRDHQLTGDGRGGYKLPHGHISTSPAGTALWAYIPAIDEVVQERVNVK